jgi:hypothetical protein
MRAKLKAAKANLAKASKTVIKKQTKIDAKRIAVIKAKIAAASNPKRKKALVAQLKAQKKVAALRK